MSNQTISLREFCCKSHSIWEDQWLLLTSGDYEEQKVTTQPMLKVIKE